jgi:hypothetical protein
MATLTADRVLADIEVQIFELQNTIILKYPRIPPRQEKYHTAPVEMI